MHSVVEAKRSTYLYPCTLVSVIFPLQWGLCEYVIVHTIWGGSPVILWISLGGKPKWLPLKFGYHDVMRTSPIAKIIKPECAFLWPGL